MNQIYFSLTATRVSVGPTLDSASYSGEPLVASQTLFASNILILTAVNMVTVAITGPLNNIYPVSESK